MHRFRRVIAAVFALVAAPLALAESKDPAAYAPADALVFVGVTDMDELSGAFEKTSAYKLSQDPVAKEIMHGGDAATKMIDLVKERLGKTLGVPASSLKNPFKGAVAFWVSAPRGDEKIPEIGLVAGVGDKEALRKYYDAAVKKLKEASTSYESVGAGSNTIDFFKHDADAAHADKSKGKDKDKDKDEDDDDDDKDDDAHDGGDAVTQALEDALDKAFSQDSMPPSLAMCLSDERLYVAATPDAIKETLRREKGGDTLVDSEDYKQIARQFKPAGQIRFLFNVPRLLELVVKDDPDAAKPISATGMKSLRSVIGHMHVAPEAGVESKAELLALISGERAGVLKILSMDNRPVTSAATVPAESIGFLNINMNLLNVIDESERIMRQFDPDAADAFREQLNSVPTPDGGTMSPRKDVLEHLREPISAFVSAAKPFGADSIRAALSIGHRDRAAMEKFLGFVQSTAPFFQAREVRGTQTLEVAMFGVVIAVLSDQLVIGNGGAVEGLLATGAGTETIAADASFKAAAKHVPAEVSVVFYLDARRNLEAQIGFAEKKDQLAAGGGMGMDAGLAMLFAGAYESQFKEGKTEDARKLVKYQTPQMATLSTTTDGLRITGVVLSPPKSD